MSDIKKTKFFLHFVVAVCSSYPCVVQAQSALDFDVYRSRIEPIFLKKREGGMRCYDCHSMMPTRLKLEPLSQGNSSWTEEQSRRNFEAVSLLVTPANPLQSRLLLHPLAPEAGGDPPTPAANSGLRRKIRNGR